MLPGVHAKEYVKSLVADGCWKMPLQGVDGAKLELQEVVDFLKNPDKYTALGAKIPKVSLFSLIQLRSIFHWCT